MPSGACRPTFESRSWIRTEGGGDARDVPHGRVIEREARNQHAAGQEQQRASAEGHPMSTEHDDIQTRPLQPSALPRRRGHGRAGDRRGRRGACRERTRGGFDRDPTRHVTPTLSTHFGRIFERMPAFADLGARGLEAALVELGSPGGILDARDALELRAGQADYRPLAVRAQRRQPHAHGGHDIRWSVHGPRHDLRHLVAARQARVADGHAERPDSVVRPRLGLRRGAGRLAAAVRPVPTA